MQSSILKGTIESKFDFQDKQAEITNEIRRKLESNRSWTQPSESNNFKF